MGEDADVRLHPWVHVALDIEDRLRLVELRGRLLERRRHRLVESRVDLGKRVDIVEDAVGVEDLVGLTDHEPHYVRLVLTAVLIEDRRSRGSGPGLPGRE